MAAAFGVFWNLNFKFYFSLPPRFQNHIRLFNVKPKARSERWILRGLVKLHFPGIFLGGKIRRPCFNRQGNIAYVFQANFLFYRFSRKNIQFKKLGSDTQTKGTRFPGKNNSAKRKRD